MRLDRVLVGFGRVLMSLLMITLNVVIGGQVMMLRCFFVVLGGFVVCFVCHVSCPLGNLPARSYARPCEFGANNRRRFTEIAGNSRIPTNNKIGD